MHTTGQRGQPCASPQALSCFLQQQTRSWKLQEGHGPKHPHQTDVGGLPSDLIFGHRLSVCRMGLVHGQQTLQPKTDRSVQHVIHPKTELFLVIHKVSS